ncbi:DUF1800 domain-containing protein [uncultured Aquimonas sp.]|uniref:DUF1800 domain-containing protein n=1 Tax=uncultured Aquimonas sp. TaxID=385483 RepID=UPI002613DB17|nr:DUF1800 domain-containing protein [uncultured Aquimonas sp.]
MTIPYAPPRVLGAFCLCMALLVAQSASAQLIFRDGFDPPPEGPFSEAEASRFLSHATFGPTLTEITRLRGMGYTPWLNEQFSRTASLQLPHLDQLMTIDPSVVWQDKRNDIWFRNVLYRDDQLRQRMAFALSQIFVVSDQNGSVEGNPNALAHYHDMLSQNAFGNFRTLLENVTLHPVMGHYLSMFKNRKPDEAANIRPDENYAREIMQLFSIGLVRLNPDGTVIDGDLTTPGIQPIPTYTQDTIRGFAHVFTGWNWATCNPPVAAETAGNFNWWDWLYCAPGPGNTDWRLQQGWRQPMRPWGEGTQFGSIYHASAGTKQLLNYPGVALSGGVLPAGGQARANMAAALDNVFNHPNVGPFFGRLLIQRFTTSNPSPAYVARVAAAFNNNGSGVRGDLQAVLRAVLLDPEARNPSAAHAGKLREPLLRVTQLWRGLNASSSDGAVREWPDQYGAQAVLSSPTVFNFFLPNYQLPGELATLGLFAPEFQITTDTYITRMTNEIGAKIFYAWQGSNTGTWNPVKVDLNRDMQIASDAAALVDRYNLLFMGGRMSAQMRTLLINHLNGMSSGTAEQRRARVQDALWLILTSPEYVVEK